MDRELPSSWIEFVITSISFCSYAKLPLIVLVTFKAVSYEGVKASNAYL
jgi:hypothetical protein